MARKKQTLVGTDAPATRPMRCAIYCRKSTTEGLDREFNSLDAQRESGEAYVSSQRHEGWVVLPQLYHDGGFTGGNTERPALQQLLADIDAGLVDVVVVYKIDRLSRSLVDFLHLMQHFDDRNVALASVTQQIRTDSSMGRLMLNILAAFGEYERELISERTKDKMSAARRKGKFVGGSLPLGYDLDLADSKLRVNPTEAAMVRDLFLLYRTHQGLLPVVKESIRRGWSTKTWVTRDGTVKEGRAFNRMSLHYLLTNVLYIGKVKYEDEIYDGEHEAIVDERLFAEVQDILKAQGRTRGIHGGNSQPEALLKSLLTCGHCGKAMIHSVTRKRDGTRYRYYVCTTSQKEGVAVCPTSTIPAAELEEFVVARIKQIAKHPAMMAEVVHQAKTLQAQRLPELETDVQRFQEHLQERQRAGRNMAHALETDDGQTPTPILLDQLHTIEAQIAETNQQLSEAQQEIMALSSRSITIEDFRIALELFDPVWDVLYPTERSRILRLLIEKVDLDSDTGRIGITFHPTGIAMLKDEMTSAGRMVAQSE